MKQKYLLTSVLLLFIFSAVAQPDTTRRDTSWAGSPHRAYRLSILDADVLEGRAMPVTITPTGQRICFDKIFKIKTETAMGPAEGCLFINTEMGLMANTPIKRGSAGTCDINISKPDFGLLVLGLKGNTYNYFNAKKKDRIEHWMSTSNSENYQYQFMGSPEAVPLTRRTESKLFFGGKVKAWAYKVEGRPETWWLFGKTEPAQIVMTPKKFLGAFAVGYQYTDKGLFIILQITSTTYNAEVMDIQDMDICFDPSSFKIFENENYTKQMAAIARGRAKLRQEEAKIKPDDCPGQQQRSISFQYEALNRRQENLDRSRQGNTQQSIPTQQAQAQTMINYDDMIQINIYETELKICRAQKRLSEMSEQTPASRSSRQKQQEKIACLDRQLAKQIDTQQKMQRINRQFPNEPGRQYAEKTKLFMQGLVGCD